MPISTMTREEKLSFILNKIRMRADSLAFGLTPHSDGFDRVKTIEWARKEADAIAELARKTLDS